MTSFLAVATTFLALSGFCPAGDMPVSSGLTGLALWQAPERLPDLLSPKDKAPTPPPVPAPSTRSTSSVPWLWIILGVAGAGVLAGIIVVVMKAEPKKPKPVSEPISPDKTVDGYRPANLISTGQTSQVWDSVASGGHVAIKVLLPEYGRSPEMRESLFREGQLIKNWAHPYIVKGLDNVKHKDYPFIVMELFPSVNLKARIQRKDGIIKERFQEIVERSAAALAYVHGKGYVHRDVKPDHILVNNAGEVRLIDFGLARPMAATGRGLLGGKKYKPQGTRSYIAPEQIRGEKLDERTDLYSFGATLYELLAGRPPFRAASPDDLLAKQLREKPASPQTHNADVTAEMAELVLAMLAKKREERPKDFEEFLVRFRRVRPFTSAAARRES
jgi:serine/threonine protein kinase